MEQEITLPDKIEAKRGGYAVVFIYVGMFLVVAFIGKMIKSPPTYLYMAIAIIAVFAGYYLVPIIFNKPVISAAKEGVWTSKLNLVPWRLIKDIRTERSTRFSPKGFGRVDIDLIIETNEDRTDTFDVMYLNVNGEEFCKALIKYWKANN